MDFKAELLLNLRPNFIANFVGQAVWQWHVVQIGSHFLAIFEGPVKKLEGFVRGSFVGWVLVHQDERGCADGPAVVTFGVNH